MALSLAAMTTLATPATSTSQVTPTPHRCQAALAPRLCTIHFYRQRTNRVRRRLALAPLPIRNYIPVEHRDRAAAAWRRHLQRIKRRWQPYAIARAWARQGLPACISRHEGGLTSVNPAGPYYGKWQADAGFEAAYNPRAMRRLGNANHWPEAEQDLMAYRGYQHRGYTPWPETGAICGA